MGLIGAGLVIGIGGTVAMDLWAWLLARLAGVPMPNWGRVGRWVAQLPRGRVFHTDIGAVAPVSGETALGWVFHYAVGAVYGVIFALIAGPGWFAAPSFLPVWIFALVVIAGGWFLLHPGMGLGWALSKTEAPAKGRFLGLVAHTVFGLGMYAAALTL
ncbi:DUF2938 domain-containing protein [Thalassococcus sp. CAU 1522]|uniref:DUF2938 domain-containing protein n=1 Tax=Thalassococcus arenae TaxID=2851652 RepID=A0ABS6N5H1_9RHOB|nr:DUF2938 domain-containing protein [Thalassococcus arenae]MBV2358785.1 DUF2938 domain-containing protein [Thalassococcus arenae]